MDYQEIRAILDDPEKMRTIRDQTVFLDQAFEKVPVRQRLWHTHNHHMEIVRCEQCGIGQVSWNVRTHNYGRFCSRKCQANHPSTQTKRSQTNREKYGVDHVFQSAEVSDRIATTNHQRYGSHNPFGSKMVQDKIQKTNLEKYGTHNPAKSLAVKQRIDRTHRVRYGIKRTSQLHIPQEILRLRDDRDLMMSMYVDHKMSVSEIAGLMGINHSQLCEHFKNNLGIHIHRHNVSQVERQIAEFLSKDLGLRVETSVRNLISPKEIDIFLPDLSLGIEVDGLAWHTENRGKHRTYHAKKHELMRELGYDLINITDLEWNTQNHIVKSRLRAKTNLAERIPARQCQLVQLNRRQSAEFFSRCHIQGTVPAGVRLGLQYQGNIVAAMALKKFRNCSQWELLRFANQLDVIVIGGASKLFTHFLRTHRPECVVSYCDRRWHSGNVYPHMGFEFQHFTGPNYWYTKNTAWHSGQKFHKHKMVDLLDHHDPEITQWKNMSRNGWDRYWDCGNSVWMFRSRPAFSVANPGSGDQ